MEWLYGDDASWYAPEGSWSVFSGEAPNEEKRSTMTTTLSPRAAAQKAADQIKKLAANVYNGGKWYHHAELDVIVLDPPGHAFLFAFHLPTLSFFRSSTRNNTRITSSSLRTTIDPYRAWIVDAMKNVVPSGPDFLAYERGDQEVMMRRAEALKAVKVAAAPVPTPPPSPITPSSPQIPVIDTMAPRKETSPMALLDIQSKTSRVIVEEISRTLDIDRKQLVAILRSAGAATMRKDAKIRLLSNGSELVLDEGAKLRLEWTETKETEESS